MGAASQNHDILASSKAGSDWSHDGSRCSHDYCSGGSGLVATITVHEPDGEGRVFVDVVGTIDDEDFETFKEKTDQIYPIAFGHPKKQVIVTLVSYGGSTNPALQIGDWIRKRGMSTFVPGDRTCTSACALIWLAGVPRTVGDTPQIGFHAAYDPTTRRETGAGNAVVGAYLRDLGVGYKAIVFMTRKGPTSVEWLTPDLAKELGVAWAMLQPPRAIPIPPQPKLAQPTTASPGYCGVEVRAAAVADSDGPRITEADAGDAARDHLTGAARDPLTGAAAAAGLADTPNAAACGKSRGAAHRRTSQDHRPDRARQPAGPGHTGARAGRAAGSDGRAEGGALRGGPSRSQRQTLRRLGDLADRDGDGGSGSAAASLRSAPTSRCRSASWR